MIKGKSGLSRLNNTSETIWNVSGSKDPADKINANAMKLLSVLANGGTTTDTTISFYARGVVVKTLTSVSGAISDTTPMAIAKGCIDKIVLTTTGDHSSAGIGWILNFEA